MMSDHVSDIPWNNIEIDSLHFASARRQTSVSRDDFAGVHAVTEMCTIGVAIVRLLNHACKVVHPGSQLIPVENG